MKSMYNEDNYSKAKFKAAHISGIYVLIGAIIGSIITGVLTDNFVMRLLMGTQGITGFQVDAYKKLYDKYEELNSNYVLLYQNYNKIIYDEKELVTYKHKYNELQTEFEQLEIDYEKSLYQREMILKYAEILSVAEDSMDRTEIINELNTTLYYNKDNQLASNSILIGYKLLCISFVVFLIICIILYNRVTNSKMNRIIFSTKDEDNLKM